MKSFSHHLKHWRSQPESRRERRALLLAGGFTALLFILWLASFRLSTSLRETPTVKATASVAATAPGVIERIKAGWQTIIK